MKLAMNLGSRSYDIIIKRGSLQRAGKLCNLARKVLVVTDDGVPPRYAKTIAAQCAEGHILVVKQGEGAKCVENWRRISSKLLHLGFTRGDAVAAVGGGVVGDLAGFAAATYMRGIPFFQFPTTTLSQIDSSIGGKVAVDLDGTKNIVGAFHQPGLVAVDPDTLATLPKRHFANGMAEALKTALIGSADLFDIFEHEYTKDGPQTDIERILFLCLSYKMGVVERDETEQGERKLLNFGHTIGHGIEAAGGLGGLLHGECVALGMLPMIEGKTLRRRTLAIMKKLGLPLACPYPAADILKHITSDKKRINDSYTIVRVKKAGQGYLETVGFDEIGLLVQELANGPEGAAK